MSELTAYEREKSRMRDIFGNLAPELTAEQAAQQAAQYPRTQNIPDSQRGGA